MLTRNRALTRKQAEAASILLNAGDFNVRICVLDRTSRYYTEKAYKDIRASLVQKALGIGITNSENQVELLVTPSNTNTTQKFLCTGPEILDYMPRVLDTSFRIDIIRKGKMHSWIFLV